MKSSVMLGSDKKGGGGISTNKSLLVIKKQQNCAYDKHKVNSGWIQISS